MSDELIKTDDNGIPVLAGIDTNGNIIMLRVDDSGYLLCDITLVSDTTNPELPSQATLDQNNIPVVTAITDDENETITPFMIDSRNGFLFCDITFFA